jgi:hydroxymethylbilane synthase
MRFTTPVRIATRGSPLALYQAHEVRRRLALAHGQPQEAFEILVIKTSGDRIQDRALSEAGGKGLFTKEIEEALLDKSADLAVHSAKDMPTMLPDGLVVAGYLDREDVSDAFLSNKARTLQELPAGAVVGTASLRRQALVRKLRPDLKVALFRGNVETRIRKIDEGEADATLLAIAGLKRLGLAHHAKSVIPLADFPPAVGQGAILIEARGDDADTLGLINAISHRDTHIALNAERAFLHALDGSCRTPIAGYATVAGSAVDFHGLILRTDGSEWHEKRNAGTADEAALLGRDVGLELKARAPAGFFSAT